MKNVIKKISYHKVTVLYHFNIFIKNNTKKYKTTVNNVF